MVTDDFMAWKFCVGKTTTSLEWSYWSPSLTGRCRWDKGTRTSIFKFDENECQAWIVGRWKLKNLYISADIDVGIEWIMQCSVINFNLSRFKRVNCVSNIINWGGPAVHQTYLVHNRTSQIKEPFTTTCKIYIFGLHNHRLEGRLEAWLSSSLYH